MQPISQNMLSEILTLLESGYSARKISSKLHISHTAINKIRDDHFPSMKNTPGGHPAKLSSTAMCHAHCLITTGKANTAVDVAKSLQDTFPEPVSAQNVRRGLKKIGLKAVVKAKRPFLSKCHIKERMDFALSHQYWTVEDWKRVIWSDETKINLRGSDGRKWVWKTPEEGLSSRLVEGTFKFGGGNLMLWGCMNWDGVGYACRIDGKMDSDLYVSILEDELQKSLRYWGKTTEEVVFQQDNDPKHTSKKAKAWLNDHGFEVMVWPPQSPDLNPIEHLWFHLKRRLAGYEKPPKGILELWERVQREWEAIDESMCQDLISSMPRRVQAVLKAKGGYTKY